VEAAHFDTLKFVAADPVPELLQHLTQNPVVTLAEALLRFGGRSSFLETELTQRNLVATPGGQISSRGRACYYCIEGIEGVDLTHVVDNLRDLDPALSRISLVREGMTTRFVEHLHRVDPIRRVMICSPWVNLDRSRLRKFIQAIEMAERLRGFRPEITVVTRPLSDQPQGDQNATLSYLRRIGSLIVFQARVHSKLYIVEGGEDRVQRFAFVGSENFTKVRFQELGILVNNDNQLIDDLTQYFLSLALQ
jgi:hypothetical protein